MYKENKVGSNRIVFVAFIFFHHMNETHLEVSKINNSTPNIPRNKGGEWAQCRRNNYLSLFFCSTITSTLTPWNSASASEFPPKTTFFSSFLHTMLLICEQKTFLIRLILRNNKSRKEKLNLKFNSC